MCRYGRPNHHWRKHPRGNLEAPASGIDHGHSAIAVPRRADYVERVSVKWMEWIVDRDSRTQGTVSVCSTIRINT
jgi:hypothetical protein